MAVSLSLLRAILLFFLSLHKSAAQNPQIDAQKSCRNQRDRQLICELQEAKLRIARLESIFEESLHNLSVKSQYIEECTKLVEENSHEIERLQSTLLILKDDSSGSDKRLEMLEEEVRLLWDASRKNNFDLHTLESKAQGAENRLEGVKSRAQVASRQVRRKSCNASAEQKKKHNNDMVQSGNSNKEHLMTNSRPKLQVKRIKTRSKVPAGFGVYVSPEGAVIDNMNGNNSGLVFMPTPGEVIYQDGSSRNNTPPATRMYISPMTSSSNPPTSSRTETLNQSSQLENMRD